MSTRDLKKRLHYLKGQIEGIERMLDGNRDAYDVYIQFKAIEGAIQKAIYVVLDEKLRKELALLIVKVGNACPGDCKDANRLEIIRQEFPRLDLKRLTQMISEVQAIDRNMELLNTET